MAEWTDTGPDFPALAAVMQEMKVAIMRLEAENQPEPGPAIADPAATAAAATQTDSLPVPVKLLANWREILVALGLHDNREDKKRFSG